MKARPTITKRLRERAKEDKKRVKAARRDERREEGGEKTEGAADDGEDPDIAGIVPGPQALDPELFGADYHKED